MNKFDYRIVDVTGDEDAGSMNISAIVVDDPSYVGIIFDFKDVKFTESDEEDAFAVTFESSFRSKAENQFTEEEMETLGKASSQLLQQILDHILNEGRVAAEQLFTAIEQDMHTTCSKL